MRNFLRSLRNYHFIILAVVAVASGTVTYYRTAEAQGSCYAGTVLGRACFRGYFSNTQDNGGTNVLPEISGGLAIPTSVNTADELYNLLRAAYNSTSAQRKTGAAFIYNTMMGRNAPGVGRTVSNAQWLDLRDRLRGLDNAGKIRWSGNVASNINSYWQGTTDGFPNDGKTNDDAFYDNYKNETGILIRDYNNNVVYEILRRCANPIGNPRQIPQVQDYKLTPHVDTVTPQKVEVGGKVSVYTSVNNVGDVTSDTTQWEITQMTVAPGKLAPHENQAASASGTAPCEAGGGAAAGNYYQNADAICKNVAKGSGRFNLGSPSSNLKPSALNLNVDDLPAGTRLCFSLSVKPFSRIDTRWMHSQPICTIIGKKPKVQVWGGDLYVRGDVETGVSIKSSKNYGSWVEYGLLLSGVNDGMASGSALHNGGTASKPQQNRLTFANVDNTGADRYGYYTLPPAQSLASQFTDNTSAGAPNSNLGALASGTYKTTNFTINASDVGQAGGKGKSIVIIASGTVTINGNITYKGPGNGDTFNSLLEIPQVVIIANKINIRGGVQNIDAWLLTTGNGNFINTCSDVAVNAQLSTGICNNRLTVNGPVETSQLYLRRTAGSESGANSDAPAEVFNLRGDGLVWARAQASAAGKAQTVYTSELPPRF